MSAMGGKRTFRHQAYSEVPVPHSPLLLLSSPGDCFLDSLEVAVLDDHSDNDIQSIVEAFEAFAGHLDQLRAYHASNAAGPEIDARIERAIGLVRRGATLARQLPN